MFSFASGDIFSSPSALTATFNPPAHLKVCASLLGRFFAPSNSYEISLARVGFHTEIEEKPTLPSARPSPCPSFFWQWQGVYLYCRF